MSARTPTTVRFEAAVPQFTVPDVSRAAEYYRDILGFQIAGYWDGERVSLTTDPPPVFGIVRRDHVQVFFTNQGVTFDEPGRHTLVAQLDVDPLTTLYSAPVTIDIRTPASDAEVDILRGALDRQQSRVWQADRPVASAAIWRTSILPSVED